MSPYNALSVPQQLKSKSCDQSDAVSKKAKTIDNFTLKLCLTTLIATFVYLPNFSQAAYSADLKFHNQTVQSRNKYLGILPKIVDLLPTPLKKLANLSPISPNTADQDLFLTVKAQSNKSYFDHVVRSDEQELLVAANFEMSILPSASVPLDKPSQGSHSVKSGDTVYKIAQHYQVSSEELIQLNKIENSDVILVDQELMIPQTASNPVRSNTKHQTLAPMNVANLNPKKSLPEKRSASTDLSNSKRILGQDLGIGGQRPTKKMAKLDEDPYIAGLRADIEKLRAEYRQQQQQTNAPIRRNIPGVDGGLNDQLSINAVSTVENKKNDDDVATSLPSSQNLQPGLFAKDNVSLQLPPLSSPEEYLPSTFDGYTWPAKGVLTSGYGWRWGRLHGGIDIAAPVGTPVIAAASGEVISSGWNSGGYGNLIELKHLDGSKTLYAHNNRLLVSAGQRVNKGEQIAEMGSTGYSTGSHLHFEIHPKSEGAVNPLAFLN